MSKISRCPACGKLIAARFPMHDCKPQQAERFDRLNSQVTVTFNKPVTEKQMHALLIVMRDSFENAIMESDKLAAQVGHVVIGSPLGTTHALEICI